MNSTTVTFYCAERCCYQLNLPVLFGARLSNLKKLFIYMFSPQHREKNKQAIVDTEKSLQDTIEQQKEAWRAASKNFASKYVDVKYHYEYTAQQKNGLRLRTKGYTTE